MKKLFHYILKPNKILGFILFNVGMGLLIYVFSFHLEETPLAYLSYLLSTYALIIFCIWFYKACQFSTNFIKTNSKFYQFYKKHSKTIMKASFIFSFLMNLIYGIFKLTLGIYYKSEWFITFAAYYLLLCFMKASLAFHQTEFGMDLKKEYQKLKHTGMILLLLDIILTGMIILIVHQNQVIKYPGYLIYVVAMYDFYLIISAFIKVLKSRKEHSPILISRKCINLTVAMISILSLEVAMIYEFGSNDTDFKLIMTACTGFGIALINSVMAIYMILKSCKQIKRLKI